MALEVYIDRVIQNKGLARQTALALLRWFIKTIDYDAFEFYVKGITDVNKLKILWEAGLDGRQQRIVLKRYDELTGEEFGTWRL